MKAMFFYSAVETLQYITFRNFLGFLLHDTIEGVLFSHLVKAKHTGISDHWSKQECEFSPLFTECKLITKQLIYSFYTYSKKYFSNEDANDKYVCLQQLALHGITRDLRQLSNHSPST